MSSNNSVELYFFKLVDNFVNNLKKKFTVVIEEVEIVKENIIFKIPGKLN